MLQAGARATVEAGPVVKTLTRHRADIVFLDPPYPEEREYEVSLRLLGEKPAPLVIVQHSVRFELETRYGALIRTRILKQGENALSFFAPEAAPSE